MSTLIGKQAPDFTTAVVLANGEIANKFHLAEVIKTNTQSSFYPLTLPCLSI